jgi:hypothetical protein
MIKKVMFWLHDYGQDWFYFFKNLFQDKSMLEENNILKEEVESNRKKISELELKLVEQEKNHTNNLNVMKASFEDIKLEITKLMEENQKLINTIDMKNQIIDKQDKKTMKLLVDINRIECTKEEMNAIINNMYSKKDKEIEEYKNEVEELVKNYEKVNEEYKYILEEYQILEEKLDKTRLDNDKSLKLKDAELVLLKQQIDEYKLQLKNTKEENSNLNEIVTDIENKLQTIKKETESFIDEYNEMKITNETIKSENETLRKDLDEYSKKKKNKKNKKL